MKSQHLLDISAATVRRPSTLTQLNRLHVGIRAISQRSRAAHKHDAFPRLRRRRRRPAALHPDMNV